MALGEAKGTTANEFATTRLSGLSTWWKSVITAASGQRVGDQRLCATATILMKVTTVI